MIRGLTCAKRTFSSSEENRLSSTKDFPIQPNEQPVSPELVAYELIANVGFELVAAPVGREWMDSTPQRFANRCLPLLMANQAGWCVLNNARVRLRWNGGVGSDSIEIDCQGGLSGWEPMSHFGHGVVTWRLPYLFRTSPGFNLLVRGPANFFKDGVSPLEGLVETDWLHSTFTLNWKITRPNTWITFEKQDPLCMLVPQKRGEIERFNPRIVSIDAAPTVRDDYLAWSSSRSRFNAELKDPISAAVQAGWQKEYFQGRLPDGSPAAEHQTRMHVKAFTSTAATATQPSPSP